MSAATVICDDVGVFDVDAVAVASRRLVARRRNGAASARRDLRAAESEHGGASGYRAKLGRWVRNVPVGRVSLAYAQVDVWKAEGERLLRVARLAESEGLARLDDAPGSADALGRLAIAADAFERGAGVLTAAVAVLEGIAAREAGRCR